MKKQQHHNSKIMPKIDVDTLKVILHRNEPDDRKVKDILNDILLELRAEEEEKEQKPPAVKKQFVVVLSDPLEQLKHLDIIGWVVQIPEGDSPATAPERIIQAAYEFNTTPKGRRLPVQTIGEACEVVSSKFLKEKSVWVKTKTPVIAIRTLNAIPNENAHD